MEITINMMIDTHTQFTIKRSNSSVRKIDGYIVSVAYTWRGTNICIISARLASKKERLTYGQKTTA